MIIVAHGVRSTEEAIALDAAGVDILVVPEDELPESLRSGGYLQLLSRARLAVALAPGPDGQYSGELATRARYVQTTWGREPPQWLLDGVRSGERTWLLDAVPADLDDDPAWVAGRLNEHAPIVPAWAEIDLTSDGPGVWPLLLEQHDDELNVVDLDTLAATSPLVFRVPLDVSRFAEMRSHLRHAHGWSLSLTPGARPDDLQQVTRMVRHIRAC